MNDLTLACQDEQRRYEVRKQNLNGLDYLEVSDDQLSLCVHFLEQVPEHLKKENVRIEGGQRIRNIQVVDLEVERQDNPELDSCLRIIVDRPGDFSTYTLRLVTLDKHGQPTNKPHPDFDPRYAQLEFSFKVGCPNTLDCKSETICPPEEYTEPEISYLAKDYASFRQLILDRLALLVPGWQERHVPDLGITLVELLAYVGDYLSYYQDAVATEAYLETARQRISVHRHTRLVDYQMHEGCNARTWVCVKTDADVYVEPKDIYFTTSYDDAPESGHILTHENLQRRNISPNQYEVFEPLVENPDPPIQFRPSDFKDLASLATKLQTARDPLSQHLRGQFSPHTQRLLDEYDSSSAPSELLEKALMAQLNRILKRGSLYSEQRFAQVILLEQTQALLENLQGEDLVRLNRWLLEEAYPREIAKSKLYFYRAHNQIHFYTWGNRECCLPRGATTATLLDAWVPATTSKNQSDASALYQQTAQQQEPPKGSPVPTQNPPELLRELRHLQVGDVLIFEEVKARTGVSADADPTHRHAVCLTRIEPGEDPLYKQQELSTPVVEIEWAVEDALPFPLCLSTIGQAPECNYIDDISVAWGNVILVDHGRHIEQELLGTVPLKETHSWCEEAGWLAEPVAVPGQFRPRLQKTPLTFSQPLPASSPASGMLTQEPRQAQPQIKLTDNIAVWLPQPDLLNSQSQDPHFVVEMDNEGCAHLRFGDGELGQMPEAETTFLATYRVGNGLSGNVGAEVINQVVWRGTLPSGLTMLRPRNPLSAKGGTPPEPLSEVKLFAPSAFRKRLERAITTDDYARLVLEHYPNKVQRATATLRWTGSGYEVLVAIDPLGQEEADENLLREITGHLYRYRRIGHEVLVASAHYVSLDIAMTVCVLPPYLRAHVEAELRDRFSNRILPKGQRGFFHPDNLTFGEGIALSKLVAVAQSVPGVESVTVTKLERLYQGPNRELDNGFLPLNSLEIARLDNDPNFPEKGQLRLEMRGGR